MLLFDLGMRFRWWATLVRVVAPLGALVIEGWPALIAALLVQEGGLWLTRRISGKCQTTLAQGLFLVAYGVRMAIVLPTHFIAKLGNGNGALYRDDYTSDLVGDWLVRIARGDGGVAIFAGHQYLLSSIYSYLLMGMYAVLGYQPLVPKLLNIGLAALCAVLVFDITAKTFDRRAAILAALCTAVLPSLVVWSIATLKETLVLFAALLALWIAQFLSLANRRHPRIADALVALTAVLVLLLDLRSSITFVMLGLLGLIVLARTRTRLGGWQLAVAGAVVVGMLAGGLVLIRVRTSDRPLAATFEDVALQIRHRRAQEAAGANSQVRPETDVVSVTGSELPAAELASDQEPFSVLGDIVDPLGYALLAPAPWQAQSLTKLAASAEMPVWYLLLAASFVAWRAAPRQRLFVVVLAVYGVANWLILAAVEGNLGNLLRHRLMLDPTLLILGAAGVLWCWQRVRSSAVEIADLPDHERGDADDERSPDQYGNGPRPGDAARRAVGAADLYDAEPAASGGKQGKRKGEPNRQE
jgi:hypothetical protein